MIYDNTHTHTHTLNVSVRNKYLYEIYKYLFVTDTFNYRDDDYFNY